MEWPALSSLQTSCRNMPSESATKKTQPFLPTQPIPKSLDGEKLVTDYHMRRMLVNNWLQIKKGEKKKKTNPKVELNEKNIKLFSPLQRELLTLYTAYTDVLYTGQDVVQVINGIIIQ